MGPSTRSRLEEPGGIPLPKTNSSPLKIGPAPEGKSYSNYQFPYASIPSGYLGT